jgi:hypothetical protein
LIWLNEEKTNPNSLIKSSLRIDKIKSRSSVEDDVFSVEFAIGNIVFD